VGLYDPEAGVPLQTAQGGGSAFLQDIQVLYRAPLNVKRFAGDDWYRFGENIYLLGFDLERSQVRAGGTTSLALFWRADAPSSQAMKRFVHLVAPNGGIVAQWDEWPVNGLYPSDRWLPQHIIADEILVKVPYSAAPGQYKLVVGLYDGETLERPLVFQKGTGEVSDRAVVLPVPLIVR